MSPPPSNTRVIPDPSRRRFLQGLAAGGVLMGLSPWTKPGWAGQVTTTATGMAPVLSGTEFDLIVAETAINYTGSPRMATTINGSIPSPILRWREGDTVTIRVTNRLNTSTSIHWHGIILPNGWRSRNQLCRYPSWRNLHLPFQGRTGGHLLVSLPQWFPGTDRHVRHNYC